MVVLSLSKLGYLSEAQVGGYPFDTVIQVVSQFWNCFILTFCLECVSE